MGLLKFFNVGSANTEIDRQAAEITRLTSELATAQAAKPDAAIQTALDAEKAKIAELVREKTEALTALNIERTNATALMTEHAKVLQDLEASVESRASSKALTIVASQGVPVPVSTKPADPLPGAKKDFSHLKGLDRAIAAHQAENSKV